MNKRPRKEQESRQLLTCLYPVRSSRKVLRSWDGPAPCVFCTLDMHAWQKRGGFNTVKQKKKKRGPDTVDYELLVSY